MHTIRQSVTALALATVAAVALLSVTACATTQSTEQQIDDATITAEVKGRLAADPDVNPFEIDVDTTDRVVTLRGRVEDAGDRTEAGRLAGRASGVIGVRNQITIGEDPDDMVPGGDAVLVAAVEAQLAADPNTSGLNIDVDVKDQVVTLSGVVRSAESAAAAEEIAESVQGVRSVRNELQVQ